MAEMVEKVAELIEQKLRDWLDDRIEGDEAEFGRHVACVVLTAMREPTAALIDAGRYHVDCEDFALECAWRAMIDAALAEQKAEAA